jgi:hypothetical protein
MNTGNATPLAEMQREVLLREGRAVLRSLGQKRLAREFCQRAESAPTNEALADLLMEFLELLRSR